MGNGKVQIGRAGDGPALSTRTGGALSPNGRWLAVGNMGDTVQVLDAASGATVATLSGDLRQCSVRRARPMCPGAGIGR